MISKQLFLDGAQRLGNTSPISETDIVRLSIYLTVVIELTVLVTFNLSNFVLNKDILVDITSIALCSSVD